MKRLATASLFVAIILTGRAPLRAAAPDDPDSRVLRIERWLKAVLHHSPGAPDAEVVEISSWSSRELDLFQIDQGVFVRLMRDPRLSSFQTSAKERECLDCFAARRDTTQARLLEAPQRIRYTDEQIHRLKVLACAAAGSLTDLECVRVKAAREIDPELERLAALAEASKKRGDDNYLLRRAALLHTDVAMVTAGSLRPIESGTPGDGNPVRVQMIDGRQTDIGIGETHWVIGRALLDGVRPGHDPMVELWYRATAAWMQREQQYNTTHLQRAREMFPDDADIAFLSGTQSETYAGAAIQSFIKGAVLPTGLVIKLGAEGSELKSAETFLQRAVKLNPDFAEARVRLGHVLVARGKPEEAAANLRAAGTTGGDPLLQYFAAMFLGAAEEALGRRGEARNAYEGAAALFPTAQSPRLALSALAAGRGDRSGAVAAMNVVFEIPDAADRYDPWWQYLMAQGRNADELLEQLRKPFREAQP